MKKSKKAKKNSKSKKVKSMAINDEYSEKPIYCTECGKDLDAFYLDKRADNNELVRRNHDRCVRTGKFKGEFCSKLFIISPLDIEGAWFRED